MSTAPHRRYNPLMDEWIIVSPHRLSRPWKGQVEPTAPVKNESKAEDHQNPLLPGATRPGGVVNPNYESTFVFTNDFSALLPDATPPVETSAEDSPLFRTAPAKGTCRVMCFHPDTKLQLATMDLQDIQVVIREWMNQANELSDHEWVQIFENKGAIMGCSNGHPHCQIWASHFLPNDPAVKDRTQKSFHRQHAQPMLVSYLNEELKRKERLVVDNQHWAVVVPYWACWPFETMLLPKRHILRITDLTPEEVESLAAVMKSLLIRYDNLFSCSCPYSMGWQGAPTGSFLKENCQHWQLHAVWLPPLLRSADVKKFMAGYELVCEPQRDLTPERAAQILREQSEVHFSLSKLG